MNDKVTISELETEILSVFIKRKMLSNHEISETLYRLIDKLRMAAE